MRDPKEVLVDILQEASKDGADLGLTVQPATAIIRARDAEVRRDTIEKAKAAVEELDHPLGRPDLSVLARHEVLAALDALLHEEETT